MEKKAPELTLQVDLKDFFREQIALAEKDRNIQVRPLVGSYLVDLLSKHMVTDYLYDDVDQNGKKQRVMLAELFLQAGSTKDSKRIGLLKRLGDRSLYVSGFFSASLTRKIIDIDYYIDMGSSAFSMLSGETKEDTFTQLYTDLAVNFVSMVDILTFISERSNVAEPQNILRTMEVYAKTGLPSAGESLVDRGVFHLDQIASSDDDKH